MLNHSIIAGAICSLLLMISTATAQRFAAKPEDAALADDLSKKFEKSDQAAMESASKYTFMFEARSEAKVSALLQFSEALIALKDESTFYTSIFYDEQSEISRVRANYGTKSKPYLLYPNYEDYTPGGYFYSDAKICKFSLNFDTRGDRKRYEYLKKHKDVKYLTKAFFHSGLPTLQRTLEFVVPDWLGVELVEINFEGFDIEKSVEPNTRMKNTVYKYTMKNLDPLKSESNAPNISKRFPHIIILCKSYEKGLDKGTLFHETKDLYSWYRSLTQELKNEKEELKPLVEGLIADASSDIDKVKAIFYWVQDNVRYIAFEDGIMGFKPDEASEVYKKKYGDCKGMANLTKNMLEIAGLDARLTWIGTRAIPYDYSIPSLAVDNHMICTVYINDKQFFLDATEEYVGFGDYAYRIQGRPVLIEDGENYKLDKVPEFDNDHNKTVSSSKLQIEGQLLKGQAEVKHHGESKTNILRQYAYIQSQEKENAIKAFLSDDDKNMSVSNIATSDFDKREVPVEMSYDLEWSNQITSVAGEVYVNITWKREYINSEFDEDRVNDYEFPYKVSIISNTTLDIPAGYKVDYVPGAVEAKNEDFSFDLKFTQSGNSILYTKKITINNAIVRSEDFEYWNATVRKLRSFYKDQIVLVKR